MIAGLFWYVMGFVTLTGITSTFAFLRSHLGSVTTIIVDIAAAIVSYGVTIYCVRLWKATRFGSLPSPTSNETESHPEILTPLNFAEVGLRRTVSGSVRPPHAKVQVLVHAGDGRWYLQGPVKVDGSVWSVECQFGNADMGVGGNYQVIAIAEGNIKDDRMSILPEVGAKSGIIKVRRTR